MKSAEQLVSMGEGFSEGRLGILPPAAQELLAALLLLGTSEAARRLRLQVEIAAPHLKGAVVEAGPGLARELLARRLYGRSGASATGLLSCNVATAGAVDELCLQGRLDGVLVASLDRARPAVQRQLAALMQRTQAQWSTRWFVFTEHPVRTLAARKQLIPELARAMPEVTVRLTPLRERREDLPSLASDLLRRVGAAASLLTAEALDVLQTHPWPGDLDEFVRALTCWTQQPQPTSATLAGILRHPPVPDQARAAQAHASPPEDGPTLLQDVIDRHLLRILKRCNGNKLRAAEMLGISRSTLYRMLEATATV